MSILKRSFTALAAAVPLQLRCGWPLPDWLNSRLRRRPAAPAVLRSYQTRHGRAAQEPRAGQLADDPPHLRRLGLQPARPRSRPPTSRQLQLVWTVPTGEGRVHEAAPIVNNGVMFVTTPNNQVIALDAKTGERALALPAAAAGRRVRAARHQPRRRALRRQGLLRRRRSGARRARRQDRQGGLDDDGRRQQVGVLHRRWRRSSPTAR